MKIIYLDAIKNLLKKTDIIPAIESAFVAYSNGNVVQPPVGELRFDSPPGDVHIKYGYVLDDEYYVVKIASGFYNNPNLDLPSSNGLMLLFSQKTWGDCRHFTGRGPSYRFTNSCCRRYRC
jgi:ornithine cyclodeaminase